jgi:hypothetical protein
LAAEADLVILHNHRALSSFPAQIGRDSTRIIKLFTHHAVVSEQTVQRVLNCKYDHIVFLTEHQQQSFNTAASQSAPEQQLPPCSIIPEPVAN